jgi:DNA-binding NarL/FixJ family response regulator
VACRLHPTLGVDSVILPVFAKQRPHDLTLAALRAALEHVPSAAFVAHATGEIRFANAAGAALARREATLATELARAMAGDRNGQEPRFASTPLAVDGLPGWFLLVETPRSEAGEERLDALFRRLGITPRQREVAQLLLRGATNLTIAELLGISERTVETHLTAVYQRAGVENRASLVSYLLTWGRVQAR